MNLELKEKWRNVKPTGNFNKSLIFGISSLLLWIVTGFLSIFIHEMSHGLTAIVLGGSWNALYVNPIQGFVFTQSNDIYQRFWVIIAGTGGILISGLIAFFIQKKIKSSFCRLILLNFTFYAATEPLSYWGLNSFIYLITESNDLGDLGNLMVLFSELSFNSFVIKAIAIVIIILSLLLLIYLLPKYFLGLYKVFSLEIGDKTRNLPNLMNVLFLFFIPYQIYIGILSHMLLNADFLFNIIIRFIIGAIFARIGFKLIKKSLKSSVSGASVTDTSYKFEEPQNISLVMENFSSIHGNEHQKMNLRGTSFPSKRNIFALGIMAIILSSIWLGIFGYSEETATGLNWNETPYMSNIDIIFNEDRTIQISYKFHPNFPSNNLGEKVYNWENYIETTLEFSEILIKKQLISVNDLSFGIDGNSQFWAAGEYFSNSRKLSTGMIQFSELQNISVDSGILTYNIMDPWMLRNNNSFIDAFKIQYSNNYEFLSISYFKNKAAMNVPLISNKTGQFIIYNADLETSPLIYQLKIKLLS